MRYIGIDYGTKRVGIAVSDEAARFALPHSVIPNDTHLLDEVRSIADQNKSDTIVIGESRSYDMKPNRVQADIAGFKMALDAAGLKTFFEPEFMTSQQAEREQGKHEKIDASAAALILQSFLDKINPTMQSDE